MGPAPADPRSTILAATIDCIGGAGMAKLRVDEVARRAGVGRATLYRYFPGGRDQLVSEAITWEVGRFFTELARAVADAPDLRRRLERALMFAHRSMVDHVALQRVLVTDRERFLPQLHETAPLVLAIVRDYLAPWIEQEQLRPGLDPTEAADYLARLLLSFIPSPGQWDLDDPDEVAKLVDQQFLAGILS